MPIIPGLFYYMRPSKVDEGHVDDRGRFSNSTDEQIEVLVADLVHAYRTFSEEYRIFRKHINIDRDHVPKEYEFKSVSEFVRWLSLPGMDEYQHIDIPRRDNYSYSLIFGGGYNRSVYLKPKNKLEISNESRFNISNSFEASFYEAWPLGSWLIQDSKRNMLKLEEIMCANEI